MRQNARPQSESSRQRDAVSSEQSGKLVPREIRVFAFAPGREGIKAAQEVVDKAGMAHDQPIGRKAVEKIGHQPGEVRLCCEIIGAGKGGVESNFES